MHCRLEFCFSFFICNFIVQAKLQEKFILLTEFVE